MSTTTSESVSPLIGWQCDPPLSKKHSEYMLCKAGNRKISKLVVLAEIKATLNIFQNFLAVQIIVPMRRRVDFCGTGHAWVNRF